MSPVPAKPRLLVGQFWQESHSFNPLPTSADDFTLERGPEVIAANRTAGSALGGILRAGEAAGVAWLPSVAARARPGGPVEERFFTALLEEILASDAPDAVCLDLHGAMLSRERDDCEGDLLTALRAKLGPDIPIAVALDLHAHVTPAMAEAADILIAYKTNPHADMVETGAKTFALLQEVMAGRLRPLRTLARLPFLTRGNDETCSGPLAELQATARALCSARPGLRDISICNVNPFVDAPGVGQTVLVTSDGDADEAQQVAARLARRLWELRDLFQQDLPSMETALTQVRETPAGRPFALGDQGDRVLAGAPGDATALARLLLRSFPDLRVALPLYDPDAVRACGAAGLGKDLNLAVGGRVTPGQTPLEVTGRVLRLGDGRFAHSGAYMTGVPVDLGPTALLQAGKLSLLLTTKAPFVQDPAAYESQGLTVSELDAVVAKSGNHFKLAFAGQATPLVLDTPGLSRFHPSDFPFSRARPIHPLDAIELSAPPLQTFGGSA
ncbi:M81 family metallopeptidase [Algihabitans albus]|uniref:M81 family metallopeptidase n=1 Tax=Algihabitans albus TaxID=2164067 RepID=UPI000E5D81CD|nr:M81 family metallopeptidase [Algihabitans albus]